jgi:hypothetical protein
MSEKKCSCDSECKQECDTAFDNKMVVFDLLIMLLIKSTLVLSTYDRDSDEYITLKELRDSYCLLLEDSFRGNFKSDYSAEREQLAKAREKLQGKK